MQTLNASVAAFMGGEIVFMLEQGGLREQDRHHQD
jgi:hypothetical protein